MWEERECIWKHFKVSVKVLHKNEVLLYFHRLIFMLEHFACELNKS